MKLTKYAHACIVLEEQGKKLVIDPGEFTPEFGSLDNVAAVVVTHVHGDHLKSDHLKSIIAANPNVKFFTTSEVAQQFNDPRASTVKHGDQVVVGPFALEFFGEMHATVLPDIAPPHNIGVMVNSVFYYPGDSFTAPNKPVTLPAAAPWLKTSESVNLLRTIQPKQFIRTHDAVLSQEGKDTADFLFNTIATKDKITYTPLNPGESLEF